MSNKYTSLGGTFAGSLEGYFGRRSLRVLALMCGIALALVLFAGPARAETFMVDSLGDAGDADTTDGTCATADGECTLRAALQQASATSDQADTITFASGVSDEITLSNGELRVESAGGPLRIEGPGADQLAVDGADLSRVFLVTTGAEAEIAGLTVRDGNVESNSGGGIFNGGKLTLTNTTISSNDATGVDSNDGSGGGIYNNPNGTLTVNSSTISDNTARFGGGIYDEGTVTVTNSTISGNSAGFGGGIYSFGTLTVTNSTISDNTADFVAGGIENFGTLTINNSTISGNSADSVGGIENFGSANLENTIVANSTGPNCRGSINSLGSNLEDDDTCDFDQPSDKPNTNPRLGPLQDNGGPTKTHALQTGSPAIDAVASATTTAAATEEPCGVTRDQRGVSRPQDGDNDSTAVCDIGSVEKGLVALNPGSKDYGNQKVDTQSASQIFTVENTGDTTTNFTVSSVSIAGADPGQFTKQSDNCQNATLAPGESCIAEVVFSPNSTGDKNAVLRVESNASPSADTAQLSGTGAVPGVSLTPTAHDYGNQQEGTTSSPQTFTVENTGDAELDVGVVDIQGAESGQFIEQTDNCEGNTVAPGDTCTVEVAFSPDSAGDKSAVLRVQSDASSSSDAPTSSEASTGFDEVQLSGSGTAVPVPPPVIDVPIVDTPPIRPPSIKPPAPNIKPPNNNACTIRGNNKDNVLRGTPKRDVICGFGGNDRIRGLGGNDIIKGGRGHDIIYGNRGNDKLFGQKGNDALFGGKGRDVLLGGKGKNALVGGKGKDVERGGVAPADTKKQTKKLTKKVIKDIFKQVGIR